jgi:molybdate transport system substrate-binding protein
MIRPRRFILLFCLLAITVALSNCKRAADDGRQPGAASEINVAAAANLTDAFNELGQKFTGRTGVRVVYSFGATTDLARQIENGAPFDAFAAADVSHVDGLVAKNLLVADTRAVYARGRLVLWRPADGKAQLNSLEDLAGAQVTKIAVAKPELAPYGQAAVEALRASNLWERVEPKIVYAENVAQTKQFASSGNADAAFIPRSLVKAGEGQSIDVDARLHQPIDQAIAVARASSKQDAARKFVAFVLSAEGQALLERYGYEKPTK